MKMTAPSQQAGKTLTLNPCSLLRYQNYSVVGEASDAWSELASLKVFQPESWRPTLDLVDVINPSSKSRKVTSHDAEDLDRYLASNPMIGGTRFM